MRSLRLIVVTAAASLMLCGLAAGAAAQTPGLSVEIHTVPALAGVHFRLGDEELTTDSDGVARTTVDAPGSYRLGIRAPIKLGESVRIDRVRWSDGSTALRRDLVIDASTRIAIGMDLSYLVRQTFTDAEGRTINAREIDSVAVEDEQGRERTYPGYPFGVRGPAAPKYERHPAGAKWLAGVRLEPGSELASRRISYEVLSVVVDGDILEVSSRPYFPASQEAWTIGVGAYLTEISARDALLRFTTGSHVMVNYPDGRTKTLPNSDDASTLLPRGAYVARANASGIPLDAGFTLPGTQGVSVRVISWADIAIVLVGLALLATLAVRRARRPATVGWTARLRRPASAPSPSSSALEEDAPPVEEPQDEIASKRYVRVHVKGGRAVEGWTSSSLEDGLLLMSVVAVRDDSGRRVTSTPLDSFLAAARIERVESLEGPGWNDAFAPEQPGVEVDAENEGDASDMAADPRPTDAGQPPDASGQSGDAARLWLVRGDDESPGSSGPSDSRSAS